MAAAARWLDGDLQWIETELRERFRVRHPILRVPLLADPEDWADTDVFKATRPYAVLCADFDSYPEDARFAIRALATIPKLDLHLVGKAEFRRDELLALAARCGSSERLVLEDQFVSDAALRARYRGARVLLAPLRDDDRSRARFPSKVADYLLSGRPVVSNTVGEVATYLQDGWSAFLAPPGDERAFADAVKRALDHPDREEIAERGKQVALEQFDLSVQGPRIVHWLSELT